MEEEVWTRREGDIGAFGMAEVEGVESTAVEDLRPGTASGEPERGAGISRRTARDRESRPLEVRLLERGDRLMTVRLRRSVGRPLMWPCEVRPDEREVGSRRQVS